MPSGIPPTYFTNDLLLTVKYQAAAMAPDPGRGRGAPVRVGSNCRPVRVCPPLLKRRRSLPVVKLSTAILPYLERKENLSNYCSRLIIKLKIHPLCPLNTIALLLYMKDSFMHSAHDLQTSPATKVQSSGPSSGAPEHSTQSAFFRGELQDFTAGAEEHT